MFKAVYDIHTHKQPFAHLKCAQNLLLFTVVCSSVSWFQIFFFPLSWFCCRIFFPLYVMLLHFIAEAIGEHAFPEKKITWKHSKVYFLPIAVSRAKILGNSEIFVKSGSDINLTCVAVHSPAPPSFIYWYKEGRVINYSQRGGISVLTERKTRTSKLVISKAMSSDSGNYTCIPSSSGKFCLIHSFRFFLFQVIVRSFPFPIFRWVLCTLYYT